MFTQTELSILKNFAGVNTSQVVHPDCFKVANNAMSVVAEFPFDHEAYDFEKFGIYDMGEFLSVLQALKDPVMKVNAKNVVLECGDEKIQYFTSPLEVLPSVPNVSEKFDKIECEVQFCLTADKFAMLSKMSSVLKAKLLFVESNKNNIRLTVADTLESSNNIFEVMLTDGIDHNSLPSETNMQIKFSELNLFPGDYSVSISMKGISKWENMNGIVYYIGCNAG